MDKKILTWSLVALIALLFLGLGGWYWYLRHQEGSILSIGAARGFGAPVPSFTGTGGSTFENIVSGLGFQTATSTPSEQKPPRLWRALATPGAGHGFLASATSTLRFLERSSGYLFEADVRSGKSRRITGTLIPKLYEAYFSGDGSPIAATLIDDQVSISSFRVEVGSSTDSLGQLVGTPLGNGILRIAPHPKNREFFALVADGTGSALIRSAWDGSKPSRLFVSPLQNWNLFVLSDDTVIISQSAASGVPGSAFRVTASSLSPLVRAVPGLTVLPRAKSGALLIGSDGGGVTLGVRGSAASSTVVLPIRTLAEKCVWAPGARAIAYCAVPHTISSARFLDDWYRGLVHTTDSWWIVHAGAGTAFPLFTPEISETPLDVENPVINEAGEYIAFRNAYDKSVWVLRIAE